MIYGQLLAVANQRDPIWDVLHDALPPALGIYAMAFGAVLAALLAMLVLACWRFDDYGRMKLVRYGMGALAGLLTISSLSLVAALATDDFTVRYVAEHSEKALPLGYKLAAFWAAQGGGLLLWAWAMALMGAIMAWRLRKKDDLEAGVTLAVMAVIVGFFILVMLIAGSVDSPANPLEPSTTKVVDGAGLNPALQNVAMVAHPPTLFLGYAGFAAPFALLLGSLVAGKSDGAWLKDARTWALWSWIMLTIGIVLGCWWAYTELGWGGYWAWDPVENASLLPWLTGTALLHSAVMQAKRGSFKRWTASLVVVSFLLCIFGTYITRSGIKSVHSFAASSIPTFFLILMAIIVAVGTIGILMRLKELKSERPLEDILSRDGMILVGNVLLVVMTATVAAATALPLVMELIKNFSHAVPSLHKWLAFADTPIEVKPAFYNKMILPMGLALAAIMATGPILGHGGGAAGRSARQLGVMGIVAGVAAAIAIALGYASMWAALSAAVVSGVAAGVVMDVISAYSAAGMKAVRRGLRHWGAQVAHLGLAAVVAGIAGTGLYQQEIKFRDLTVGVPATESGMTVTFRGIKETKGKVYDAHQATVNVVEANGQRHVLTPEIRVFARSPEKPAYKVALDMSFRRDVYVRLLGTDEHGHWAIEVILNPLVNWIWIGGTLLVIGGAICLVPTGPRQTAEVPEENAGSDSRKTAGEERVERRVKRAESRVRR